MATVRQFKFGGQGQDDRKFTLMQLAQGPTDFSDTEFEMIAAMPVGSKVRFNEETSSQFHVERLK